MVLFMEELLHQLGCINPCRLTGETTYKLAHQLYHNKIRYVHIYTNTHKSIVSIRGISKTIVS